MIWKKKCSLLKILFILIIFNKNGSLYSLKENSHSNLYRVCYYTLSSPKPSKLNATLCTHIIAGFSSVINGTLNLGSDYNKMLYLQTTNLKKYYSHLKVLLSVGGGGNNSGFSNAFNSTSHRRKFIKSALFILKKYNFDGLDIDWEFPVWNDDDYSEKENFIYFLKEFKMMSKLSYLWKVNALPLLTVAVAAPKNIIEQAYDIPKMAKYVDFINLMSYDYHDYTFYLPFTGHNSPLFNRSIEHDYFATLNTAWSSYYWYQQGMPKSKIMVGIPTYAHTYKLLNPKFNGVDAPATGLGLGGGDLAYYEVCKFLSNDATLVFDNESKVPYTYKDYDWISYEDNVSILGKAIWIKENGFGGAMTFDLNSDDWKGFCSSTLFPLHQILYSVFTTK